MVFFELALLINAASNALAVSAKNNSLENDCYVVTLLFQLKIFLTCFADCVFKEHFTTAYMLLSTTCFYSLSLMEIVAVLF